jgi:hypothetical protein
MAKLSARGATVVARFTRESPIADSDISDLKRVSVVFTSDGRRLAKVQIHFLAYWHDYGWKVSERGVSDERRAACIAQLKSLGYVEV